jgi:CRP-like cAMP-binding protein
MGVVRHFISGAQRAKQDPLHEPLQDYRQNHLLAALPSAEFRRLLPNLELVQMKTGEILHEPGDDAIYVYFPTTAVVSLLHILEDGGTAETAVIGNEGMVGISLLLGGSMASHAVVQNAGSGYRIKAQLLKREFEHAQQLLHVLLRYFQSQMTHTEQTAVCNRHHSVEQQLCRLLLTTMDRLASNTISMTHELIANMLGVRREGISEAAANLQRAGMIKYQRGKIEVLARPKLEHSACECYAVLKSELEELLDDMSGRESVAPLRLYHSH